MFAKLIEMMVYIAVALLAVKLFLLPKGMVLPELATQEKDKNKSNATSWKAAADAMVVMEDRLAHLQMRDVKNQERLWKLEDENNDLRARLARTTQELLLLSRREAVRPHFQDDDDEDDIQGSIPPNS